MRRRVVCDTMVCISIVMHSILQPRSFLFVIIFMLFWGVSSMSVSASNIPIASTVELAGTELVEEGMVVVVLEEQVAYSVSSFADDPNVYGVTSKQPPVFFSTGTNTVPVISEGVAQVRVVSENGPIKRGELLVSASTPGSAMRAGDDDQHVFAIALEAYADTDSVGYIQAEIGVSKAQAERASQQKDEETQTDTTLFRGATAAVLVIGALFFVLYSFRSAIVQGVTSVGRNPRARIPIMTLSVANVLFALVLCVLIIFIAVAILVLPL